MIKDDRLDLLTEWVSRFDGFADVRPEPASEDASFRRYFRVHANSAYIVMDAPPPQEDCRPFVQIAGFLEEMSLNSPRVLEGDLDQGFLLLTDLGSVQYLRKLESNPEDADALYGDALDALLVIQEKGVAFQRSLPAYDEELLRFEMSLFPEWLCKTHLGIVFSDEDEAAWQSCCDAIVACALQQPQAFVHRDYHSRNLMVTKTNNPGILDFQDAVEGPYTYDLVSLLKDCYIKWPDDVIVARANDFFNKLKPAGIELSTFIRDFDLVGVQRHLKAAGIFARLLHRDGKTGYLKDVPRTLSYIVDIAPKYDELAFLAGLITDRVLPALKVND